MNEADDAIGNSRRARLRQRFTGLDNRYWRLWGAVASSNIGDGFASLALPWVATLLTRDPLAISGVALATTLPWLLFSLQAGVLSDALDRRRLMVVANSARAAIAAGIAVAVALDAMSLPLLYAAAFALGMCEVAFDNTSQSILPAIVPRDHLERANGNIVGAQLVIAQFVARPLAGAAIGLALALPFAIDAATAALSAALVFSIPGRFSSGGNAEASTAPRPTMRAQIAEGLRWLWRHRLLRRLAVSLGVMNGMGAMVMATLVLFAQELLGLDGLGFGLMIAAGAVGGVLGSVLAPGVTTRLGSGPSLTLVLVTPVGVLATMAATSQPVVVSTGFALYGFTVALWNVVTVSLRQTIIPDSLLGRVNSVYRFLGWGAMPIGTVLGGAMVSAVETLGSREVGLRSPFIVAAAVHLILAVVVAPRLRTQVIDDAKADAARPGPAA